MAKIHITVRGRDRASMADLVRVHGVRVYPQTLKEGGEGFQVDAVTDDTVIRRLVDAGYDVDRHEDVDEAAQDSLRQVGRGNRYAGIVGLRFVKAIARVMRNGRIVARFAPTISNMSSAMSDRSRI